MYFISIRIRFSWIPSRNSGHYSIYFKRIKRLECLINVKFQVFHQWVGLFRFHRYIFSFLKHLLSNHKSKLSIIVWVAALFVICLDWWLLFLCFRKCQCVTIGFKSHEKFEYEFRRYSSIVNRWENINERKILAKLFQL